MRSLTRRGFLAAGLLLALVSVTSALTPAQQTTLALDLAANTATVNGVAIKDLPKTADNAVAVAQWYNQPTNPPYLVWRTDAPVVDILDQVIWTNYTPNDAADNTNTYANRAALVRIKQNNLQLMLSGRDTFNASKPTLRGGLNDATLNLPTGASGALRSGGWANIAPVLRRPCTRGERLFVVVATGVGNDGVAGNRGTATNPDLLGYEGQVSDADIRAVWGI